MQVDFLAIGHVSKDLTPGGFRLGGSAAYAALTAQRLGLNAAVVTSASEDLDLTRLLPGVAVHTVPSPTTTVFENTYVAGARSQVVRAVAGPIGTEHIPEEWRRSPLVLLGPLVGEVDHLMARHFPGSIVAACLQGWLRRWDDQGRVRPAALDATDLLPHLSMAYVSVEDVADPGIFEVWKEMVPVLIVTMGRKGARLHVNGAWHHVESFPAREVDPTGAGDVFGAAYLVRRLETGDPLDATRFASCAASLCVEAHGLEGVPARAGVEARLRRVG